MNKKVSIQCVLVMLMSFSFQAHAVKPFTVTCGDGKKIEVTDSGYTPSAIAFACLSAGHKPPQASRERSLHKESFGADNSRGAQKVFRAQELRQIVAKKSGRHAGSVDHSDIILMLQGCSCISPSCVAYLCPVDVDIP